MAPTKKSRQETTRERETQIVTSDDLTGIDLKHIAAADAHPFSSALRVVVASESATAMGKALNASPAAWSGVTDALDTFAKELRRNDLTRVEDMLMAQAVALQSLFVR